MDVNTEAAIICVGILVSLLSSVTLAACLFGFFPKLWQSDSADDGGGEPWCCSLAARWAWYRLCCCCRRGLRAREWLKGDLERLENSEKLMVMAEMRLFVLLPTGKTLRFDVNSSLTIRKLKKRVHKLESIPLAQQDFVLAGESLADDRTLADCDLKDGATLPLVLRKINPVAD